MHFHLTDAIIILPERHELFLHPGSSAIQNFQVGITSLQHLASPYRERLKDYSVSIVQNFSNGGKYPTPGHHKNTRRLSLCLCQITTVKTSHISIMPRIILIIIPITTILKKILIPIPFEHIILLIFQNFIIIMM